MLINVLVECVSFVVVERLGTIWTCLRVFIHSRTCVSEELIPIGVSEIQTLEISIVF